MKLAIFDVDGTLTVSNEVDDRSYLEALALEFGIDGVDPDWSHYESVTDGGILREIFRSRLGRMPVEEEIARFRTSFIALVTRAVARDPGLCRPVPGSAAALADLARDGGWAVALATGGWRASAALKLRAAGHDVTGLPGAFAEDALGRDELLRVALRRAAELHRVRFARTVYVGDGVWDLRAARSVGLGFIGIGSDPRGHLRAEGAPRILPDFMDLTAFRRALEEAARSSTETCSAVS